MENQVTNQPKKQFSHIGLVLFFGTLIIYGVQILSSLITANIPAIANNGNLNFLVSMLPMYIIAYPIIYLMFQKVPVQISREKKKMPFSHILVALCIAYAGTYICNFIATMLTTVIGMLKQSPVDNVMLDVVTSIHPIVNLFVVVICAPIMEELLFRKAIIDRTSAYGEGVSIVFSGLLFGLFHGNLVQFAYAFLLGAFFGFIYIKTKNIVYPIILHICINFFGSFVSSLLLNYSGYMELMESMTGEITDQELVSLMMDNIGGLLIFLLYSFMLMGVVLVGIILFFVNLKKFKFEKGEIEIEKGQRFKTMILNLGVILFAAFWIVMIILQLFA